MQRKSSITLYFLIAMVIAWCVVLPLTWAYNISYIANIGYWAMLTYYIPELVVGAIVLVCLPLVFLRRRFAVIGLALAAVLAPTLKIAIGSPGNAWLLSPLLLALLSWRLHVRKVAENPGQT